MHTVLVVDDEPMNLAVLSRLLQPDYRVLGARSGRAALALLAGGERPALILLDVMMPELDGYGVMAELRAHPQWRDIPVIFVTALHAEVDEERGLELGAVDYIVKPIKPLVVLARVHTQIELAQGRLRLADQNAWLERELARRMRESRQAQDLVLAAMAQLAETRDSDTGNHILRTQAYVRLLGQAMRAQPGRAVTLDDEWLERIVRAAPMHDIGKIGIPDHILLKPGRLTEDEFAIMKTHAALGGAVIARALRSVRPSGNGVADDAAQGAAAGPALPADEMPEALRDLEMARLIATHHHERWDGLGYPDGLAGEAIPLAARLMAVADVFDALATPRVYKPAWPLADAGDFIQAQSGTQFDPAVVRAFVAQRAAFEAVAGRLAD